jgi:hypothetical protein
MVSGTIHVPVFSPKMKNESILDVQIKLTMKYLHQFFCCEEYSNILIAWHAWHQTLFLIFFRHYGNLT